VRNCMYYGSIKFDGVFSEVIPLVRILVNRLLVHPCPPYIHKLVERLAKALIDTESPQNRLEPPNCSHCTFALSKFDGFFPPLLRRCKQTSCLSTLHIYSQHHIGKVLIMSTPFSTNLGAGKTFG
jgi:hypothetical protein